MRIIKPSVEFLGAAPTDYDGAVKFIEDAGRTCYKSESKITPNSAEKFVRKLIKAGHLAMVEHSNFVVKLHIKGHDVSGGMDAEIIAGKYLSGIFQNDVKYVGGNLTAWHQTIKRVGYHPMFVPFLQVYKDLFNASTDAYSGDWEVCPQDEIPRELQRYSARFICDRGVSHELVRHRPCSFAQESTRYVNYASKDMEFIEPAGFENWPRTSKGEFEGALDIAESFYNNMIKDGHTPQQARAVLPNALKTEVIVTADLEEWDHIFNLRCHKSAHPDFVRLAVQLRDKFRAEGLLQKPVVDDKTLEWE